MARIVNDQLAATIANNTLRFGGFASLSMHNATAAAQELQRAVVELGFLGAMINDYRQCLTLVVGAGCIDRVHFSLQSSQDRTMVIAKLFDPPTNGLLFDFSDAPVL